MKIAINALPYHSYQGIENFLANITRHWPYNDKDEIVVFANDISAQFLIPLPNFIKLKIIKFKKISKLSIFIFQQYNFIKLLKKEKIDVLFCASLNCPWLYKRKIVTIHDAAPFIIKAEVNNLGRAYWRLSLFFIKHFSLHFITVSNFSKQELIEKLYFKKNSIDIIYNGTPTIKNKNIIKKPPVTSPYIIVIGNARPRKNLETLIKATHLINQEQNTIKLIIIGKADKKLKIMKKNTKINLFNLLDLLAIIKNSDYLLMQKLLFFHLYMKVLVYLF